MEGALQFPVGNYYLIVCKHEDQALKVAATDPKDYYKSVIKSDKPNPNDDSQLWRINNVNNKVDGFQFSNCLSNLVFDEEGEQIKLKDAKQNSDQLFTIEKAPVEGFYQYYWLKTKQKGGSAVELQGVLRRKQFNPNNQKQMFRFQPVAHNPTIANSAIIINNHSGKALDIPANFDKGEKIVQWSVNKAFNQRWIFQKKGNSIALKSLFNGYVLDVSGGKAKHNAKVVSWEKHGDTNQLWVPTLVGNGLYKFKSCLGDDLCLAVDQDSLKDGAVLQLSNKDGPGTLWRIQGVKP